MSADAAQGRSLSARVRWRALFPYLLVAGLVLLAILFLGREIDHHLQALESWVAALGPWGVVALIGFFALGTSLFLPESVLSVAAGALFGLPWGFFAAFVGNLLAAALQYLLSRRLLRARIQRTLAARPSFAGIQRAVLKDELRLQLLLRLTPLNPATISYLLGAAGVRFSGFLVACLALTPHLFLEVYLGHAGKHMARMAGSGSKAAELHDAVILGGLVVTILVIVLISRIARKAFLAAVAEAEAPAAASPNP